ncbi:hypothetical protein TALC_00405 [Thermoplasmatales archaeon BRNA1]|nr:hypothetical protein TALC_00405 [Thermoplasmatales archaeon BRNA1]
MISLGTVLGVVVLFSISVLGAIYYYRVVADGISTVY